VKAYLDNIPLNPVKDIMYHSETFSYEDVARVYAPPDNFYDLLSEGVWVRLSVGEDERCGQVTKIEYFDDYVDVHFRNEGKA